MHAQTPHLAHSHTVHLPLGALLSPCAVCGTGTGFVSAPTLRARFSKLEPLPEGAEEGAEQALTGEFVDVDAALGAEGSAVECVAPAFAESADGFDCLVTLSLDGQV